MGGVVLGGLILVAVLVLVSVAIVVSLVILGAVFLVRGIKALVGAFRDGREDMQGHIAPMPSFDAAGIPLVQPIPSVPPQPATPVVADARAVYLAPETATPSQIAEVARTMGGDATVGRYAESVMASLRQAENCRAGFEQALDFEFGRGSITWHRFHAPVDEALGEIVARCALMTNRMKLFDSIEYGRMSAEGVEAGSAEAERLATMMQTLSDLESMRDANLRTLAGLERLHAEVSSLSVHHSEERCEEVLADLRRLAEDTGAYA